MVVPKTFLLLALTLILSVGLLTPLVYSNPEVDALSALKQSSSDPGNVLNSWDPNSVDPCTWIFITCNDQNSVTRVDLGGQNLSDQLVPEIGNLAQLEYLELYRNNLQGSIPASGAF